MRIEELYKGWISSGGQSSGEVLPPDYQLQVSDLVSSTSSGWSAKISKERFRMFGIDVSTNPVVIICGDDGYEVSSGSDIVWRWNKNTGDLEIRSGSRLTEFCSIKFAGGKKTSTQTGN